MKVIVDTKFPINKQACCFVCKISFMAKKKDSKFCSPICRKNYLQNYLTTRRQSSVRGTLETVTAGCRARAKRKGIPCDIDTTFIYDLLKQQNGLCAVTKIPLSSSKTNNGVSNPNTVSIDRIDPSLGYVKTNVRLVTYMYNSCKGPWTDRDVLTMCKQILKCEL